MLDKRGEISYIFFIMKKCVSDRIDGRHSAPLRLLLRWGFLLLGLVLVSRSALAQQQVITQFGSGYAVAAPGQPPVLIQPFGNGATIAQPGQAPTLVQPFGQGWIVTPPLNGPIPPIAPIAPIRGIGGY